jgi:ATP-dependent Lon protease
VAAINKSDLHVHFPAGAIPKDGPSAGITVASALLSLWLNESCPKDLAMTGELTLVGEVLPIGGVREKVLAAKREGIRRVVLPAENQPDVKEIAPELVRGMKFLYVDTYEQVWEALRFATAAGKGKKRARRGRVKATAGQRKRARGARGS